MEDESPNWVNSEVEQEPLAEQLMRIGADCASRLSSRTKKLDHGSLLYDDSGLPR